MANEVLTFGGKVVRTPHRVTLRKRAVGAPAVDGVTVRLAGGQVGEIDLEEALPATVLSARVVWMAVGDSKSYHVPAATLAAMKAGAGTFRLDSGSALLGRLAGEDVTAGTLVLRYAAGEAIALGPVLDTPVVDPIEPFVKVSDPVLTGPQTEGEVLAWTPIVWSGEPTVEVLHYVVPCEDTGKTNPGTPYLVPFNVPFIAAPKDAFFIRATATGPGVPGGSATYDSAAIAITALVVTPPDVSVASAAIPATQQVKLKNVTNASFPKAASTGRATITAGTATAQIVEYVAATGMLYLGDITNGPIAGDTAITSSAGGVATADGASAAWAYKAGEPYYLAPPVMNGTPTSFSLLPLAKYATDSDHDDSKDIDLAGTFFEWLGTRYVEFAWEFTGQGVTGVGRAATSWLPIGVPTLDPIPAEDWFPDSVAEGASTRLSGLYVHESYILDELRLTLSSDAALGGVQWPSNFELSTASVVEKVVGGRTFLRRSLPTAVYDGKDYFLFTPGNAGDEARRLMAAVVGTIGGARTPISVRQTILWADNPVTVLSGQERFVGRSPEQMMLGDMGGDCMQFPRGKDFQGDIGLVGHDVLQTALTRNAMEDWEVDHGDGLYMAQTCSGICMDYPYAHGMFGSLFMQPLGNYDTKSGIHRLDWATMKWSHRKALPKVYGSNDGTFRRNMRYIAKVAGSGTSHANRTLYAIYAPATVYTGVGGLTNIQILKANANGGDSWVDDGNAMAASTFGVPFELLATATTLYYNSSTGLWRRPVGSATWTKATGLSGAVYHVEKHGSTVYACTSSGMFKAADAVTLAFTSIYSGNVLYFSICPTNTNWRVLVKSSGAHQYTKQGDTGWAPGSSLEYPGQRGDFQNAMTGPVWVQYHDTDPNVVFAMRNQHPGKSTDGGKTFRYASKNYDYSEVRDFSTSPTSADVMLAGATDRLAIAYNAPFHAQDIEQNNKADLKTAVEAALGKNLNAFTMAGTLILERGNWRRYVGQIGEHTAPKALVVFDRNAATTRTDQTATGNGNVSVVSTHNIPGGIYTFTCTTAGGTGVGKFRGRDSTGRDLGEWVVGTERVYTHPSGGTITATFSDGSVDFKAGANPAVITHEVDPVYDGTVINNSTKIAAQYGETNPAVHYRGGSGRYILSMDASGNVTVLRAIPYLFQGYMGTSGNVILASSGNGTLMRSPDEGVTWTTFASGLGNMAGVAFVVAHASPNDSQRGYAGLDTGVVKRIQNGVVATIFDWGAWLTARGITTNSPGNVLRSGRWCAPCMGIVECPFDANLVHIAFYVFGEPYALFRTQNAQAAAADVEWENITYDALDNGMPGPIQRLRQNKLTGEPIICSAKGSVLVDLPVGFRAAKGITKSLIGDIRAMPNYASFTKRI